MRGVGEMEKEKAKKSRESRRGSANQEECRVRPPFADPAAMRGWRMRTHLCQTGRGLRSRSSHVEEAAK